MSPSEWVHSDFAIRKSKRSYAHFDFRTDLSKCSDYITSPEKVATHAFYPFIHYTIEFEKYSKDKGKKIKKREICSLYEIVLKQKASGYSHNAAGGFLLNSQSIQN